MKTMSPILIAILFLFAPAFPYIQELSKDTDAPTVPFHTPAYTEGKILPKYINENIIIGPEDGVILLHTVITVGKNASLTLKPGTTVAVAEYGGIRVLGALNAKGTEKEPIQFISNELNIINRNWIGIAYEQSGSGTIEHAIFHHASPAISCSLPGKIALNQNTYLFGNLETYGPC